VKSILDDIYGNSEPQQESWGPITKQFYESDGAMRDAEYKASMRLQGQRSGESVVDKMSVEELRHAIDLAAQDEEARGAEIRREADAQEFCRLHPDYIADKENGNALTLILEARRHAGNLSEITSAYELLKSRGMLKLNAEAEKPRNDDGTYARRSSGLSSRSSAAPVAQEEDPYTMSLADLELRCNLEAAREAQRQGGSYLPNSGPEEF
jgi:hypothetical protein